MTATALKAMANQDSEPEDERLVARFLGGDGAAFEALVKRYQRPLYWLALRYVGNDADAKDVAQRAMVQAFCKLKQLRAGGSFRSWVYRTAANLSLNLVRDRKPQTPLADDVALAPTREPLIPMLEGEAQRRLREAVTKLPPRQRLVVELRIFEELPFAEVADVAECSEDAAKVNFHHALKRLRILLNEENEP